MSALSSNVTAAVGTCPRGDSDDPPKVIFVSPAEKFDNTDVTIPGSKVTITNGLKLLKVSTKTLTCEAALSLNAIESASGGVFTRGGSITMGTDNADASIAGDFGIASTLAFTKIGLGELTLSPATTRLASLDVQGGQCAGRHVRRRSF